jgi:hypothetical protein
MFRKFFYLLLILLCLILMVILAGCKKAEEESVHIETIEGIPYVMNPETPLKGTIILDVEKGLEIDPYKYEEIGMRHFSHVRDEDGEVILFDSSQSEAHRFDSQGNYLGNLVRLGQGPGEFRQYAGLRIHFMNGQIWATGWPKWAKYDKNGQYLDEQRLDLMPKIFVDDRRCIATRTKTIEGDTEQHKVILADLSNQEGAEGEINLYEDTREWIIRKGTSAFGDNWAMPAIYCDYSAFSQNVFIALNLNYEIYVKDLEGKTLHVIKKPYENVKVGLKEKEFLADWALKNESSKWILDAYPDTLVAIISIKTLPRGYLAVYRVSGPKMFEIDVFDAEGRFVYILKAPDGISMEDARFYNFGFSTLETRDDFKFYVEYKVKNLPEIFTSD